MTAPAMGPMRRFEGRVCVVTGAARGIGEAIAARLAAEGGRVAAWDVSERRLLPAVAALQAQGLAVQPFVCDVADRAAVAAAMATVEAHFGAPVAVLVNNAVWARFAPLADTDEEMVDRTLAVGLKGVMWTLQAAADRRRTLD